MPRLTEQEQQEIIRFLEADKPLPDKYRFLLFGDKREVELVWNGKTNEVCNIILPFQTIEQVDEPRAETADDTALQLDLFSLDERGRQLRGWTNKLIWGDNKLVLSSLKNGPLREEIEEQGGLKLVYIDPPFDVGADFSMDIEIGDDTFTKRPNILEEIAYRDTWGQGADSFIAMLYERLVLIRDLMSSDGGIYVHMGRNVSHLIRLVCDEVFGRENLVNEITWQRAHAHGDTGQGAAHFGRVTEAILYYTKSDKPTWNPQYTAYSDAIISRDYKYVDEATGERYRLMPVDGPGGASKGNPYYSFLGVKGYWRYSESTMQALYESGEILLSSTGRSLSRKRFLKDAKGTPVTDLWDDVNRISPTSSERLGYDTQKPEALLSRIIEASSNVGDLVADFFCGSGTTAAVAEKLGRKWMAADLGKFAIHTTRKRMIAVQREMKAAGKDYRAFELLNLGKYERQHYVGVNSDLREEQKQQQLAARERAFLDLILRAYRAEGVEGFETISGKKAGRLVVVGPINMPVTRLFVEEVILECRKQHITKVDVLGFEFEMGLFPNILDEARGKGIDISPKQIPREVFDKRAVDKNQVVFHDVAYIEVKPHMKSDSVAVELTDYSVFYSQDSIASAEESLKKKGDKVVVERGQIVKVSMDEHGVVSREVLTKKWTDWVDYWAVDFNFESKRELIRVKNEDTGEWEERWTGDYIFENEWQSFRTRKDRELELKSVAHECTPGRRKIAVKVVDIFGNDTMTIVEVNVGGKD
ncbi:MAG: site-specific DNA-methyltransferase [Coriobacteriia bacterium]|nr:site-specific DNA-methyltransferase [Coriobacteriia bacterium]